MNNRKGGFRPKARACPKAKTKAKAKPKAALKPKKQGVPEPTIVYKKWPVYPPHQMLKAFSDANALHLVTLAYLDSDFFGMQSFQVSVNWSYDDWSYAYALTGI